LVNKEAKRIWASQRYKVLIDEYIDRPVLPPPFIIISYLFRILFKIISLFHNPTSVSDISSANEKKLKSNDGTGKTLKFKEIFWKIVLRQKEIGKYSLQTFKNYDTWPDYPLLRHFFILFCE
jgi:hypothetical protein